jgi:hypothetical protein
MLRRNLLIGGAVAGAATVLPFRKVSAASVVLTPAQINDIATHFAQVWHVQQNVTAIATTTDLKSAVSSLAMSISIGGGSVSYSPAFTPPVSNMSTAAQSGLICYIIQTAMGVPLMG